MAGRVGNNEFPARCREVAITHVDRNALLSLSPQSIREQGKIDWPTRTVDPALLDGRELIFIDRLRIVQQSSDHRGLAVVHPAPRRKPPHPLAPILPPHTTHPPRTPT